MATTRIYYLIITNKSEMLVTGSDPSFIIPHIDHLVAITDVKKDKERRKVKKFCRTKRMKTKSFTIGMVTVFTQKTNSSPARGGQIVFPGFTISEYI